MKKLGVCSVMLLALLAVVLPANIHPGLAQGPIEARVIALESTSDDDGQVEVVTPEGVTEVLVDFQPGVYDNWGKRCGQDFWTADGQGAALFTGKAQGSIAIYPLAGGSPVALGTTHRMACAGPTSFQFAPDGQRVGYINYAADVLEREFPYGNLLIYETATGAQLATFEWTTAFALYDDGALLLGIFPDGKGNGTEADLVWWDGAGRRLLATLEPVYPPDTQDVDCGLTSGAVTRIGDIAYVLTGQECETGSSNWRLVSVPMAGGVATQIALAEPRGAFFSESFTTQLFPTRDGAGFLMAVPSGLSRNSVQLQWITTTGQVTPVLEGLHVLSDRFGERLTEGRHLLQSMDGANLAFVTVTGNNEQAIYMLDLSTVGGTPVLLEEQGVNQRIFHYGWAANNRLYFIAGSIESSSIFAVTPGSPAQRLARGRYYQLAVSYTGDKIALSEWWDNPERLGDDLFRLVVLDANGNSVTLREGGQEHNEIIPLAIQ